MFSYLFFSMFTKENALAIQEGKGLSNARGSRRDPPRLPHLLWFHSFSRKGAEAIPPEVSYDSPEGPTECSFPSFTPQRLI